MNCVQLGQRIQVLTKILKTRTIDSPTSIKIFNWMIYLEKLQAKFEINILQVSESFQVLSEVLYSFVSNLTSIYFSENRLIQKLLINH